MAEGEADELSSNAVYSKRVESMFILQACRKPRLIHAISQPAR